jgi:hypothetical protein
MNEAILEAHLSELGYNHFKLLVVPEEMVDKERVAAFLAAKGWHSYNVTKAAVQILDKIPKEKRRLRGPIELEKWLSRLKGDKFVFDNIDVLFSPELGKIDPIRMFKYFSREHESIVFFPGRIRGAQAEYSLEGKPDHIVMDVSEVLCYSERKEGARQNA